MATRNEAQIRFKAETKDFNASMKAMNAETKKVKQEMKLQAEQMKLNGTATEKLESALTGLTRQQELAQQRTEATRQQLERARTAFGENSTEAARLESQLRSNQIAEATLANNIAETTERLDRARVAEEQRTSSQAAAGRQLDALKSKENELKESTSKLTAEYDLQEAQLGNNASEADKLRIKTESLSRQQDLARQSVENYEQQLEQAKRQYGENSAEIVEYERQLTEARTAEQRLANEITTTTEELRQQESILRATSERFTKMGDGLKDIGSKATKNITLPILAAGIGAGVAASNFEDSGARIQNALGLTSEETEKFTKMSRNIYKGGWGESLGAVDEALIQTRNNIRGLNEADLEAVTKKAIALSDAFDADVNEVTRAANNLMEGFGITSEEAFDQMAAGAQNGLNFSNELFDNLSEYSTLFGTMGFTSGEYFQLLEQGLDAGAYNLDYINDVMKEFQIRVKDGSKATSDAMDGMSESTRKVWEEFLKGNGTVKDVSNAVLAELEGMDDQVKANEIGVGLYGTKWEDLESDAMYALGGIGGGLEDVDGTMDGIIENVETTFGTRFQSVLRKAQGSVMPLGETLLDMADDYLPKLQEGVEDVTAWFENLSPETKDLTVKAGLLLAALGPVSAIVGTLAVGAGSLVTAFSTASIAIAGAGGFGATLLAFATGPAGIAIGAAVGLTAGIYALNEASKSNVVETQNAIEKRAEEIESVDAMIERFETLQSKNKMSTDEVLRYMDIMDQLKEAKSEEAIKKLKDEQAALLEKSTLTNEEMTEFLGLNDQIVEKTPATNEALSEQGNVYAEVLDEVKKLNQAERQRLTDNTYASIREEMDNQKENLALQIELQDSIAAKERERNDELTARSSISDLIREKDLLIAGIQRDMLTADHEEATLLAEKLLKEEDELMILEGQLSNHDSQIDRLDKQIGKKKKSLEETNKELSAFDSLLDDYASMILYEQGIVSEKGKANEAIRREQKELDIAKQKLREQFEQGKLNVGAYQEQNSALETQQGKIDTAKQKLREMNGIAGRTIYKDLHINEHPRGFASYLNTALGRQITKNVYLKYNNKNGPQQVGGFATGTRYAPGGMTWVGEEGPELMHVPRGAKVIPNDDSETLLRRWNIPTRKDYDISRQSNAADSMTSAALQGIQRPIMIQPAPVLLDGEKIGEIAFETVDGLQENKAALQMYVRGF